MQLEKRNRKSTTCQCHSWDISIIRCQNCENIYVFSMKIFFENNTCLLNYFLCWIRRWRSCMHKIGGWTGFLSMMKLKIDSWFRPSLQYWQFTNFSVYRDVEFGHSVDVGKTKALFRFSNKYKPILTCIPTQKNLVFKFIVMPKNLVRFWIFFKK